MITGRLLGIGVGPGDPELLTLKALRCLQAAPVVAYVAARGQPSIARQIAAPHLQPGQREINIALPMHPSPELADAAYDEGASRIGAELERGRDVAVLCEGDPMLYGSFSQLLARLAPSYPTEIVPGITSVTAAAAAAGRPLATRNDTLAIVPATLPMEALRARLGHGNAVDPQARPPSRQGAPGARPSSACSTAAIYVERVSTARAAGHAAGRCEGGQRALFLAGSGAARAGPMSAAPAIVLLGRGGLAVALRIRAVLPHAHAARAARRMPEADAVRLRRAGRVPARASTGPGGRSSRCAPPAS